jgi:hypothetical protein
LMIASTIRMLDVLISPINCKSDEGHEL